MRRADRAVASNRRSGPSVTRPKIQEFALTRNVPHVAPSDDSRAAARVAGLRYSTDREPGIGRHRSGRGFAYRWPTGRPVRDRATLDRIERLAVPPAWRDVWICRDHRGHLQATGRDSRGRKVYRYHPRYRGARDTAKFDELLGFGMLLPRIRRRVTRDLGRPGLPREKVLAAAVRLLESTLMRVGNEEYARVNASFGLTTLRRRHAIVKGATVRLRFRGKSGRWHRLTVHDRRLARIVARTHELPGQHLFEYRDAEGEVRTIGSSDVNAYLREISDRDITSKQFRTWAATLLAMRALGSEERPDGGRAVRHEVAEAMELVAERLGNTPAVARGSYVHPAVVEAYMGASLRELATAGNDAPSSAPPTRREERALLGLLRRTGRGASRPRSPSRR